MAIHKISLGTINYTNWLRVVFALQANRTTIIYETWLDVPGPDHLYSPDLAPGIYVVLFYDALTNGDAGNLLQPELVLDGLSSAYEYERRWYEVGNMPTSTAGTATINGAGTVINDPYLIGKVVEAINKEAFRDLKTGDEVDFDNTTGDITSLSGVSLLSAGSKMFVIIRNPVGNVGIVNAMFAGTIDVTATSYTILPADKNKRFRCVGTATGQAITLPLLALLNDGDFVFIDNTVGGVAMQVRLFIQSTNRILYNGFDLTVNQLQEFWASRGEAVRLMKVTSGSVSYYEVIGDYPGVNVGEKVYNTSRTNYNAKPNNNALYTVDELPRLIWWGQNKLQDKIIDDAITSIGWSRPADKKGVFAFTSGYTHVRFPDTQDMYVGHLKDYSLVAADVTRPYNAPGGFRAGQVGEFNITFPQVQHTAPGSIIGVTDGPLGGSGDKTYTINSGKKNRVDEVGYIEFTRV